MKSRPEDRPKIIGLGIAILGVVVYVVITLVPKITGAQPAPARDVPPPAAVAASATAPTEQGSAPLPDDDTVAIPAPLTHDSFTPPVGSKLPLVPTRDASPAPSNPARPATSAADAGHPGAASSPATLIAAPVAPPLPPIELKGVILGDPAMAIVSVNNEVVQRSEGETIAGSLKLIKIQEEGILIEDGKKQTLLAVGRTFSASANR